MQSYTNEESDEDSLLSSDGSAGFLLDFEDSRSQSTGTTTPSIALPSSQHKLAKVNKTCVCVSLWYFVYIPGSGSNTAHFSACETFISKSSWERARFRPGTVTIYLKSLYHTCCRAQLEECLKTNKELETSITNTKVLLSEEQKAGNR